MNPSLLKPRFYDLPLEKNRTPCQTNFKTSIGLPSMVPRAVVGEDGSAFTEIGAIELQMPPGLH